MTENEIKMLYKLLGTFQDEKQIQNPDVYGLSIEGRQIISLVRSWVRWLMDARNIDL